MKHLGGLFLFACALRGLLLLTPLGAHSPLVFDEHEYVSIARTLSDHGVYEGTYNEVFVFKAHRPPVYPGLLAAVHALAGDGAFLRMAKVVQVLLGALVPLVVYLFVNLLGGRGPFEKSRAAFLCGLAAAAYPYLAFYGLFLFSDLVFTLLALLAAYTYSRAVLRPDDRSLFIVAGVVAGLAALTRPMFLLFPLVLAAVHLVRERFGKSALVSSALFLVFFAGTLGPWLMRNALVLGDFPVMATNGGEVFWFGNNAEAQGCIPNPPSESQMREIVGIVGTLGDELGANRRFYDAARDHVAAHPFQAFGVGIQKLVYLWNVEVSDVDVLRPAHLFPGVTDGWRTATKLLHSFPFALLTLAFGFSLFFVERARGGGVLVLFVLYTSAITFVYMGATRYHLPFVPHMMIATVGAGRLREGALRDRRRVLAFATTVALYVAVMAYVNVAKSAYLAY